MAAKSSVLVSSRRWHVQLSNIGVSRSTLWTRLLRPHVIATHVATNAQPCVPARGAPLNFRAPLASSTHTHTPGHALPIP